MFFAYIIMKSHVDAAYITSNLSYIHLLHLDEQIGHLNRTLSYFNMNSKRNCSNTGHYKLIKKAINLFIKIRFFLQKISPVNTKSSFLTLSYNLKEQCKQIFHQFAYTL